MKFVAIERFGGTLPTIYKAANVSMTSFDREPVPSDKTNSVDDCKLSGRYQIA